MFARAVIFACLYMTLIAAGLAQSVPAGWTTAKSEDGHFSVKLPCSAIGFTLGPQQHKTGSVLYSFHVGCLYKNQNKFSAVRVQYKDGGLGAPAAESHFENAARSDKWRKSGAKIVKGKFRNYPVLDISQTKTSRCGVVRFVLATPDLFVLSVEALDKRCGRLSGLGADFFSTLAIDTR